VIAQVYFLERNGLQLFSKAVGDVLVDLDLLGPIRLGLVEGITVMATVLAADIGIDLIIEVFKAGRLWNGPIRAGGHLHGLILSLLTIIASINLNIAGSMGFMSSFIMTETNTFSFG